MTGSILIVDEKGRLQLNAEVAVAAIDVRVTTVPSIAAAKRKLIQQTPNLLICFGTIGEDSNAGFHFSEELRAHPTLAAVPVLLISETANESELKRAAEVGARGLLSWPLSPESLTPRLSPFFPELVPVPKPASVKPGVTTTSAPVKPPVTPKPQMSATPKAEVRSSAPDDERIKLAQQLLAKIFNNLKTSDLLMVSELEDVPRIVYEMARSVCGIKGHERGMEERNEVRSAKSTTTGEPILDPVSPVEDKIDLEQAFQFKAR